MAKIPTNQEQLDKEKQAELEAKKRDEQEELEKARKEQEELEKAEEEKKRLEAQAQAQAEKKRLEAERLAAEQRVLEEELARNKKTTITMINPHQNAEPKEAEVHPDMVKYWEQEGWTVK